MDPETDLWWGYIQIPPAIPSDLDLFYRTSFVSRQDFFYCFDWWHFPFFKECLVACAYICPLYTFACLASSEASREHLSLWNWSYRTVVSHYVAGNQAWVLYTSNVLKCWAISPAPVFSAVSGNIYYHSSLTYTGPVTNMWPIYSICLLRYFSAGCFLHFHQPGKEITPELSFLSPLRVCSWSISLEGGRLEARIEASTKHLRGLLRRSLPWGFWLSKVLLSFSQLDLWFINCLDAISLFSLTFKSH